MSVKPDAKAILPEPRSVQKANSYQLLANLQNTSLLKPVAHYPLAETATLTQPLGQNEGLC